MTATVSDRLRQEPDLNLNLRHRNDYIQYLRGYAALMVVVDHAILAMLRQYPQYAGLEPFAGDLGALGVRIFFVISGYIMVAIAYDSFAKPHATTKFWLARIKRIAPLYYLASALVLILPLGMGGHKSFTPTSIVESLLFLPANARPDEQHLLPVLGAGWTLVYEMFFYALFGLSLLFRRQIGLWVTPAALAFLVLLGAAAKRHVPNAEMNPLLFYTNTITVLFALGMGIGIWQRSRFFLTRAIPAPAFIGMAIPLAVVLYLNVKMPGSYPGWRSLLIYGLAGASVLICVAARPRPVNRTMELLGNASFSIYLFHVFGMRGSLTLWDSVVSTPMPLVRCVVSIVASLIVGLLAYRYLEQPIVRLLKPRSRQAREG